MVDVYPTISSLTQAKVTYFQLHFVKTINKEKKLLLLRPQITLMVLTNGTTLMEKKARQGKKK